MQTTVLVGRAPAGRAAAVGPVRQAVETAVGHTPLACTAIGEVAIDAVASARHRAIAEWNSWCFC